MAKTIIWSEGAKADLLAIKKFFDHRNKSVTYSTNLLNQLKNSARLIEKHTDAGVDTNIAGIQGLIVHHYILFFRQNTIHVIILIVWDSRRNPEQLESVLKDR